MTELSQETCDEIDSLTESDAAFALYRFPSANEPVLAIGTTGSLVYPPGLEALDGRTGFVFAPFEITERHPVVLLKPVVRVTGAEAIAAALGTVRNRPSGEHRQSGEPTVAETGDSYTRYAGVFRTFTEALKKKEFEKLVLSRPTVREKDKRFSPARVFYQACRRYPTAFVYLFHTLPTGTWLGCTPETLLSGREGSWHTVALAGTRRQEETAIRSTTGSPATASAPANSGSVSQIEKNEERKHPAPWDEKNLHEQALVSAYLRSRLRSRGIVWEEKGPYSCPAGKVTHLLTDFRFTLPRADRLGDLLAALHPTPAVCGLPQEAARRFIRHHEGYDRAYYSGFAGWLSPAGETGLYVNLRCMRIGTHTLTLYAGGGLLAASELESEWQETEDKLQTLLTLVG